MAVTVATGVWVDGTTSATDLRKGLGVLLAAAGATTARPGRIPGPGAPLTVGPTAPASRAVLIRAGKAVLFRTSSFGPVLGAGPDGDVTLPMPAAPASGSLYYAVYLAQHDTSAGDADTAAVIDYVAGPVAPTGTPTKPAVPAGALLLGYALDSAGLSTFTAAQLTDVPTWTALRGAPLPISTVADRAALPTYPSLEALELDSGALARYDGTRWRYDGDRIVVANQTARLALAAYTNLEVLEADTGHQLRYDGTRWRYDGDYVVVANAAARDALTGYTGLTARLADALTVYYYTGTGWATDLQAATPPAFAILTADRGLTSAQLTGVAGSTPFISLTNLSPGSYLLEAEGAITGTNGTLRFLVASGAASGLFTSITVTNSATAAANSVAVGGNLVIATSGNFRASGVLVVTSTAQVDLTAQSSYTMTGRAGTYLRASKVA